MGRKTPHHRGPYRKNHKIVCQWCGKIELKTRAKVRYCSPLCRTRNFELRRQLGYSVKGPHGDILPGEIVRRELARLKAAEASRRAAQQQSQSMGE